MSKTLNKSAWLSAATTVATLTAHLIIKALAGTGKTTTIIEGLNSMKGKKPRITPSPQQAAIWEALSQSKDARSIAVVAFNKSIAVELQERVPEGVEAMTNHSMGFKAVNRAFALNRRKPVNDYRLRNIVCEIMGIDDSRNINPKEFIVIQATEKLVSLCKMNLVGPSLQIDEWVEALDELSAHYEVEMNGSRERVYELVPQVINRCLDVQADGYVDFDDMIWLPVVLDLPVFKYDLLLVDEAQDLNRCQQALVKKAGKRLVLVGDEHQAIYGFAGADAESLNRMEQELSETREGCIVLPLTVTRRCGKRIVEEAKRIVPEFEAHENNSKGVVYSMGFSIEDEDRNTDAQDYRTHVQDGDRIICRVNAPLVPECLKFIKAGRKAEILGRDIAKNLIRTIEKMKASDIPDLVGKLEEWLAMEEAKERKKRNPNQNYIIGLQDRYDCIVAFTDGCSTIDDVIARINKLFSDNRDSKGIILSTIHKAKGLEARRVFLLEPPGATVPHPMAKGAWQIKQEWNLRYVAITRAIEELVYVS